MQNNTHLTDSKAILAFVTVDVGVDRMMAKIKTVYHWIGYLIEQIKFYRIYISNAKFRKLLKKNKQYKGIHEGERCFILGNGPSLKTEDLKQLQKEYVFSVNQISRHPDFELIKPNYHFWADPFFFQIDETKAEDLELLNVMKKINTAENKPVCFFPIEQTVFIDRFQLNEDLNVRYFCSRVMFDPQLVRKIDFSKAIPIFGTVVQWCIIMAMYMGFKEIYLLGCDNTGLMVTMKAALKQNDHDDYAYQITDNEKKRLENLLNKQSLEEYVSAYLRTLIDYRALYNFCSKKNIKLVNCSSSTVIDSIPRKPLNEILRKSSCDD